MSSLKCGLIVAALSVCISVPAFSGSSGRSAADALASLVRNARQATIRVADPGFLDFLKKQGVAPDLSSVLALTFAPVEAGAAGGETQRRIDVTGGCRPEAGKRSSYRCSVEVMEVSGKKADDEGEFSTIFRFRLNKRPGDPAARIIGPVEIFLAG